jgi:DNA-binding PadR family transcriptional regulator
MSDQKKPEDFLPLTPIHLHILIALSDAPLHGYGIMKEVERLTNSQFTISTGTMYNSIKRLLRDGLIKTVDGLHAAGDDPRRSRYYQITALGQKTARAELRRLAETVRLAQQKPAFGNLVTNLGGA